MSQESAILEYLKSGKSISPLEALKLFGCFRLGARIWDLRHKGYPIEEVDTERNGKRFASYYLKTEQEQAVIAHNHSVETEINKRAAERQLEFTGVK